MTEHLPKALRDIALWCKNDGALSEEVDLLAAADEIERLTAENERLRLRNAALVEALRDHRCPADYRITVAECAKTGTCGCCDGILIGDALNQHKHRSEL